MKINNISSGALKRAYKDKYIFVPVGARNVEVPTALANRWVADGRAELYKVTTKKETVKIEPEKKSGFSLERED